MIRTQMCFAGSKWWIKGLRTIWFSFQENNH